MVQVPRMFSSAVEKEPEILRKVKCVVRSIHTLVNLLWHNQDSGIVLRNSQLLSKERLGNLLGNIEVVGLVTILGLSSGPVNFLIRLYLDSGHSKGSTKSSVRTCLETMEIGN